MNNPEKSGSIAAEESEEMQRFFATFNSENPRGRVIIACGFIEDLLARLLRARLTQGKVADELIEGGNAPLGTLSARIAMCYALGMLSKNEFDDLTIMRKIRNNFAHRVKASFNDAEIRDRCLSLKGIPQFPGWESENKPSSLFLGASITLLISLKNRIDEVDHIKPI